MLFHQEALFPAFVRAFLKTQTKQNRIKNLGMAINKYFKFSASPGKLSKLIEYYNEQLHIQNDSFEFRQISFKKLFCNICFKFNCLNHKSLQRFREADFNNYRSNYESYYSNSVVHTILASGLTKEDICANELFSPLLKLIKNFNYIKVKLCNKKCSLFCFKTSAKKIESHLFRTDDPLFLKCFRIAAFDPCEITKLYNSFSSYKIDCFQVFQALICNEIADIILFAKVDKKQRNSGFIQKEITYTPCFHLDGETCDESCACHHNGNCEPNCLCDKNDCLNCYKGCNCRVNSIRCECKNLFKFCAEYDCRCKFNNKEEESYFQFLARHPTKLAIGESRITGAGRGVFALEYIRKGEIIREYTGEVSF